MTGDSCNPSGSSSGGVLVHFCYDHQSVALWTHWSAPAPRWNGTIDMIWHIMDFTLEGRPACRDEQHEYDCRH
jgi:hypothetical protein